MEYSDVLDSMRRDGAGWCVNVPEDWAQGRTIFGGLQLALAARAMRDVIGGSLPLRSVQVTFVSPVAGDALRLQAEVLRVGRSATHARCDVTQDGAVALTAVAIYGAARDSGFALELPCPPATVDPDTLAEFPHIVGITPQFVRHLQLRWAVGLPPYSGHDQPHSTIFARLRDRRCTAEDAVIALADSIPTPVLSMLRRPAPVSSLNWMLEFVRDPSQLDRDGWCRIGTDVRAGSGGYLSQTSVLWGPDGHAYGVSHQTVGVFA